MTIIDRVVRILGVPESDVRWVHEIASRYAYAVRLWNGRRLEVDAVEVLR